MDFFSKNGKNRKKRQERHAKMVDVSEILLEARFFAKRLLKLIQHRISFISEESWICYVKTRKVKQQMGQMKEEVSNQDVS